MLTEIKFEDTLTSFASAKVEPNQKTKIESVPETEGNPLSNSRKWLQSESCVAPVRHTGLSESLVLKENSVNWRNQGHLEQGERPDATEEINENVAEFNGNIVMIDKESENITCKLQINQRVTEGNIPKFLFEENDIPIKPGQQFCLFFKTILGSREPFLKVVSPIMSPEKQELIDQIMKL